MIETHAFRLKPGEDLKNSIQDYVTEFNIVAGWIASGIGSLVRCHIRFANQPKGNIVGGFFEIITLSGTVSVNGSHLHISVSDSEGKIVGGHLLEGNIIYTTAEIILQETKDFVFIREKDHTTSWKELQVKKRDNYLL